MDSPSKTAAAPPLDVGGGSLFPSSLSVLSSVSVPLSNSTVDLASSSSVSCLSEEGFVGLPSGSSVTPSQPKITDFFSKGSEVKEGSPPVPPSDTPTSFLNPEPFHRFKEVPTPRVISFNLDGISAGKGTETRRRFGKVRSCLRQLARRADVLLLQEVNSPLVDLTGLSLIPGFSSVANPDRTAIFVRDSFAQRFEVSEFVVCPGFVHGLSFRPRHKDATFCVSWSVMNVYLKAGSSTEDRALRLSQIQAIRDHTRTTDFLIVGGDWNMVLSEADSASGSHYASSPGDASALSSALLHLGVHEVYQPDFTRFRRKALLPEASRLDRFYISHSMSDSSLMRPSTVVLPMPIVGSERQPFPSDHFPVFLSFAPASLEKYTRSKIPEWVVSQPSFVQGVKEDWEGITVSDKPMKALLQFKKIVKSRARKVMGGVAVARSSPVTDLTLAITFIRRALSGDDVGSLVDDLGKRSSHICSLVREDIEARSHGFPTLRKFIDARFGEGPSLGLASCASGSENPVPSRPFCFLKYAKNTLPSLRQHISILVDPISGEVLDTVDSIARELKAVWEPVWGKKEVSVEYIKDYLSRYPGKLRLPVQAVDAELVRKCILSSGSSSAGPDGIPFSVYRLFVDIATPLLHEVILFLGSSPVSKLNRSFNFTDLFFIPKKLGTSRPDKLRPISISNTDNRLIAKVLKSVLVGPANDMVGRWQHAFLPGRSIEDPIRFVNAKFFDALEEGSELYLLLIDFAKAFDSVSNTYLFLLLEHIGVPDWFINVLRSLYSNIVSKPILFDAHDFVINLVDGLKQGCPLSPLLFVIAIEPLLFLLSKIKEADGNGFADDLSTSVLSSNPASFALVAKEVDCFTTATGVRTNKVKTCLLGTVGDCSPVVQALPESWREVTVSEFERYLGTFVGREVNVNRVFDLAWGKLTRRLSSYASYKRFFTLQGRVDIANSFLLPLFSFLFRFYMMTESFMYDVERAIGRWVIPNSRYAFEHLTASTHLVGLARPLRDVFRTNVATLLSRKVRVEYVVPLDMSLCDMRIHTQVAACQ